MTASELRDMDDTELREHLVTARRELFGLRFQHATGELDNTVVIFLSDNGAEGAIVALTVARERGIDGSGEAPNTANEEIDSDG